jgi:hypothetical protein
MLRGALLDGLRSLFRNSRTHASLAAEVEATDDLSSLAASLLSTFHRTLDKQLREASGAG